MTCFMDLILIFVLFVTLVSIICEICVLNFKIYPCQYVLCICSSLMWTLSQVFSFGNPICFLSITLISITLEIFVLKTSDYTHACIYLTLHIETSNFNNIAWILQVATVIFLHLPHICQYPLKYVLETFSFSHTYIRDCIYGSVVG